MSNDNQITIVKEYKNRVAKMIGFTGGIILLLGVLWAFIGSCIVYSEMYEILLSVQFAVKIIVMSFLIYILTQGLAEIIELLQDIKDK